MRRPPEFKQEIRTFQSKSVDGVPMYPRPFLITSVRTLWSGWQVIGWEEMEDAPSV